MKATRESYGEALAMLGDKYENLVVLDADLSGATKTSRSQRPRPMLPQEHWQKEKRGS